ncbi:hypothetical protein [Serratia phage X20]|uniref:Uncharacterized protein n=3 Tax=Winklervirus TaxID=2560256 RepID=A0A1Z1LZ44_9CAUD|nr:hypothetical protein FDI23_gp091 [Serratia phage CHI14]YP_010092240.1 hypothetical protein KNT72_gp089 [Serratia phage X20]ARW57514.1 hypothetical protein [Serratia phage CHI14]ARW57789.1 hypothetical protein [Serratia phage CBH8]ARW58062.1 hypothetical protein [Serratia phage X20]
MTKEELKDYLKENLSLNVVPPSYKDSTLRIELWLEGEEITTASIWADDIPLPQKDW